MNNIEGQHTQDPSELPDEHPDKLAKIVIKTLEQDSGKQKTLALVDQADEVAKVSAFVDRFIDNESDTDAYVELCAAIRKPSFLADERSVALIERVAQASRTPWSDGTPEYVQSAPSTTTIVGGLPVPSRGNLYDRPEDMELPSEVIEFPLEPSEYPKLAPGFGPQHENTFAQLANSSQLVEKRHEQYQQAVCAAALYLHFQRVLQRLNALAQSSQESAFPATDWGLARTDARPERNDVQFGFSGPRSPGYYLLMSGSDDVQVDVCQYPDTYPHGVGRFYIVGENQCIGTGLVGMVNSDNRHQSGYGRLGQNPPIPEEWEMHTIIGTEETTGYFSVAELIALLRSMPRAWENQHFVLGIEQFARIVAANQQKDRGNLAEKQTKAANRHPYPNEMGGQSVHQGEIVSSQKNTEAQKKDAKSILEAVSLKVTKPRSMLIETFSQVDKPTDKKTLQKMAVDQYGYHRMQYTTIVNNIQTFTEKGLLVEVGGKYKWNDQL